MSDSTVFFWGYIFGAIGLGYLVYGMRQKKPIPLVCGLVLSGYTWFVKGLLPIFVLGGLFMALPLVVKRLRG